MLALRTIRAHSHLLSPSKLVVTTNRYAVTQKLKVVAQDLNSSTATYFNPPTQLLSALSFSSSKSSVPVFSYSLPKNHSTTKNTTAVILVGSRSYSSQSKSLDDLNWSELVSRVEANIPLLGPVLLFLLYLYFQDIANRAEAEAAGSSSSVPDVYVSNETPNQFETLEIDFLKPKKVPKQESYLRWLARRARKIASHLSRLFMLSIYFAPVILTIPLLKLFPSFRHTWWNWMVSAIESSGAAFVKFGQWASSRADLFSEEVCEQLGSLRNKAPEHSLSTTKEQFSNEFGAEIDEIFSSFDEVPVASGSIAQVYKATLRPEHSPSGQPIEVAVKVRHPWVVNQIHTDLLLLYWMAKQMTRFRMFSWMELPVSVRDFTHHLAMQVDLELEAKNLTRFVNNFRDIPNIHFPRPINKFVSESVIVETWEAGVPITNYVTSRNHPLNPRLARMGFTAFLKMLLIDNFIHADCHSENILVRLDAKGKPEIVMLDVGLVTELNTQDKDCIIGMMKVLFSRDPQKAADTMVNLSSRQYIDSDISVADFRKDMYDTFAKIFAVPDKERELSRTMTSVFNVMRKYRVKMESNLAMLAVSMAVLEGIARRLDPGIDLLPVAAPYLFYNTSFVRALTQIAEGIKLDKKS